MTDKNDHIDKRIKLSSLEKKGVYKVSEQYFDDLPTRIQNRVIAMEERRKPTYILSRTMKFALPVLAIIIMSIYFGSRFNATDLDVQALIDEVSTEELVAYLSESELTTDEILALIDVKELDIEGMLDEDINLLDELEFDAVLDEFPEFETDL